MFRDETNVSGLILGMWRTQAMDDRLTREMHIIETRRKKEVYGLQQLVCNFWDRKTLLEQDVDRLKRRLKDAAHRYLERCISMSADAKPWSKAHVMVAWSGVHNQVWTENRHEDTCSKLATTNEDLAQTQAELEEVGDELATTKANEEHLLQLNQQYEEKMDFLQKELDFTGEAGAEARLQAEKDKEEAMRRAIAAIEGRLQASKDEWEEERLALETDLRNMEGRLALAESMGGAGGAKGNPQMEEKWRIVDKGQGVLCCGCLTQLVHRKVRPLPPIAAIKEGQLEVSTKLDKAKRAFFEGELAGMPDPDDAIHKEAFMNKKDPYALIRLNMWPEGVKAPKGPAMKSAIDLDFLSSTSTNGKKKKSHWPRVSAPEKMPPREKGLGRAVSTPAAVMKETFSKDFRARVFR